MNTFIIKNNLRKLSKIGVRGSKLKNDKGFIYLPRHSSFTINHTFVNLGIVRHNMAESLVNTTVLTTKAYGQNRDKGKCFGSIP